MLTFVPLGIFFWVRHCVKRIPVHASTKPVGLLYHVSCDYSLSFTTTLLRVSAFTSLLIHIESPASTVFKSKLIDLQWLHPMQLPLHYDDIAGRAPTNA